MSRTMNSLTTNKDKAIIEAINILLDECINPEKQDKIKEIKNILNSSDVKELVDVEAPVSHLERSRVKRDTSVSLNFLKAPSSRFSCDDPIKSDFLEVECSLCNRKVSLDSNYPSISRRPTTPQCSTCGNYVCGMCNYLNKGIYCLICFNYSCPTCRKKLRYPSNICFKCETNSKITCKIMS